MGNSEAQITEEEKARVMALDGEGRAAFAQEDFRLARQRFEQAADACRVIGWREELVYQLLHITQAMANEQGYRPGSARRLLDEALVIAQSTGQPRWILPVQINRIRLDLQEGRHAACLRQIQASLPQALAAGFDDFAESLIQLGAFACVGLTRFDTALMLHSAAQAQRDRSGISITERKIREAMERNMTPARRAFSGGKRTALEAIGYQMSLSEACETILSLVVEEEEG